MKTNERRNKIIFGMFIIFLMISSTAGFMYSGNATKKINGFKFTQVGNGWQVWITQLDNYIVFNYLPNEITASFEFIDSASKFYIHNENWNQERLDRFRTVLIFRDIETEVLSVSNCQQNTLILNHSFSDLTIVKEDKCFYLNGNSIEAIEGATYKIFEVI